MPVANLLPGFHPLMLVVMFSIPFSQLQQLAIGGLSCAKLIVPFLWVYLMSVKLKSVKVHPLTGYFCLFILFTLPSLIWTNNLIRDYDSVLLSLIGYVVLFQLLYEYKTSQRYIPALIKAFIAGLLCVSFATLVSFKSGFDVGNFFGEPFIDYWYGTPIVSGTAFNPNGFGTLFAIGVPLCYGFFLSEEKISRKILILGALVILAIVGILTFSRSAIGSGILACVTVHYFRSYRTLFSFRLAIRLAITLVLCIVCYPIYFVIIDFVTLDQALPSSYNSISDNKNVSETYRVPTLVLTLRIISENPIFGIGYGNIKTVMEAQTGLYINSHNTPVGIAVDYGLCAITFFVATIALSLGALLKTVKLASSRQERLFVGSIISALGAMLIHGLFHELYIHFMLWFFVALGAVKSRGRRIA